MRKVAWIAALTLLAACGGKVVVDGSGAGGSGGGATTTASSTTGTVTCGMTPVGTPTDVCIPMQGDFCPFSTSESTLKDVASALGVCPELWPAYCCGQPAVLKILCDSPPAASQCCYVVDYTDGQPCPG
jgi:hypothetical protein